MIRLIKAMFYVLTGRLRKAAEALSQNEYAMSAEYDEVIKEKQERGQRLANAVGTLIAQEESKKSQMEALEKEIDKHETLVRGAVAKLQAYVKEQQGKGVSQEDIKSSGEYKRLMTHHNNFKSTLDEKNKRMDELETSAKDLESQIADHETQLKVINQEIGKIRDEKGEAIADVVSAQAEKEIADALTNIGQDTSGDRLRELRERRSKVKADAKLARKMSGATDVAVDQEFMNAAGAAEMDSELDNLLFGGDSDNKDSSKEDRETAPVSGE